MIVTEPLPKELLPSQKKERACVLCGCTESHACPTGCSWLRDDVDVCSACAFGDNGRLKMRKARKLLRNAETEIKL